MTIFTMTRKVKDLWRGAAPANHTVDAGRVVVDGKGHREYVGGAWDRVGALQLRFMIDRGLRPDHVLLDIACGSLRAGVHFIPYLEPGNYLGIDIKRELIDAGIKEELGEELYGLKKPEFVVSDAFEFFRFSKQPDFAIAQSLFTHLIERDILLCLSNLRAVAKSDSKFYATFNRCKARKKNPDQSHPHKVFRYTPELMRSFGERTAWSSRYIGEWDHPGGQVMIEYFPA